MNVHSSAYVSTASKWLPEPPSHWQVKPFRHCFRPSDERNGETPIGEMLSVSGYRGVVVKDYEFEEQKRTAEELETYRVVRPGQLAVNTMWLNYTGLGVSEHLGYVSPAYRSYWIKPGLHGRFVHHLLRSSVYVAGYTSLLQGIRPNSLQVPTDAFHSIPILVPPIEEQQIIAAYLDRETGRIDALVERLERLIALLTEKRQAVISHAVTKGLNPDAPMKDSGIDWLGKVPAHWEVKRVKWVAKMESGHTPDKKIDAYWDQGDISWVSLNDTAYLKEHEYITDTAFNITQAGIANSSARLLPEGCVAFSRDATIGRCAITTKPMAVSQHFIAWVPGDEITSEFLLYCFRSMSQELDRLTFGATVKTIGMPDVKRLTIALPGVDEQNSIVANIRREIGEIDASLVSSRAGVSTLKERRSALISAAVTGQIPIAEMTPDTQPEDAA